MGKFNLEKQLLNNECKFFFGFFLVLTFFCLKVVGVKHILEPIKVSYVKDLQMRKFTL
jgi:hypothetical protein